jgi:hypothetical protein
LQIPLYWSVNKSVDKANTVANDLLLQLGRTQQRLNDMDTQTTAKLAVADAQVKRLQDRLAQSQQVIDRIGRINPEQLRQVLDVVERPDIKNVTDVAKIRYDATTTKQDLFTVAQQVAILYEMSSWEMSAKRSDEPDPDRYVRALGVVYGMNIDRLMQQATDGTVSRGWIVDLPTVRKILPGTGMDRANRSESKAFEEELERQIREGKVAPP